MAVDSSPGVLIAGGGFGALEATLALRALAGERLRLTVLAPDPVFTYRPAATIEAVGETPARRYDLRRIAHELGAKFHQGSLETVSPERHAVGLTSGAMLAYDALILAVGARAVPVVPGSLLFRDQRDVPLYREVLRELELDEILRLAFVVPPGISWPLPLYELALFSAARVRRRDTEVLLVSPENKPLEIFGDKASRLVANLLSERGVRFRGRSVATGVRRDGSLTLQFDTPLKADRVISVPQLRGHRIGGIPARRWDFAPVDSFGRVEGAGDVYAIGDMTTYPIKQGGLAAQQADRVSHLIAGALGAPVRELRATNVLRARLLGGDHPVVLRTELDWLGKPTTAALEHVDHDSAAASTKVFGRYLTPYLEAAEPLPEPAAA